MELHLWSFKLEILQSRLPRRPPKNLTFRCRHFWLWDFFFFMLLFKKKSKPVGYTRTLYSKLGKIRSKLKLLFGVYYWFLVVYRDHLTQCMGFRSKRAVAGLGPSGLRERVGLLQFGNVLVPVQYFIIHNGATSAAAHNFMTGESSFLLAGATICYSFCCSHRVRP